MNMILMSFFFFRIKNRIENLTSSMMTWKQLEDGLSDFRDILDRDRGKLQGLEGALAQQQTGSGRSTPAEVANSVREVVKALSEKVEPLFQVIALLVFRRKILYNFGIFSRTLDANRSITYPFRSILSCRPVVLCLILAFPMVVACLMAAYRSARSD